ncbi:MAG: serine hydrolase domain-containing protein [Gemmatimonadota bacterium]
MPLSRCLLRLCALLLLTAPGLAAQSRQDDSLPARISHLFASVSNDTLPGCVIGVARQDRPTLYQAFGTTSLENRTPIDTATIFEAGSVSKQFTAGAIVRLAQAGKLSLDDQVRHWLPELSAALPPMTIRQMLHHESGWRDWGDLVELAGWPRGTRTFTMEDALKLLARQQRLNFTPGAEYLYSNSNFVLAAWIVARASGQTFADYTRHALFVPLGMTSTQWRADFSMVLPHRAAAWSSDDAGIWHLDMPFENVIGHGGMLTTVPDLLRWQANFKSPAVGGAAFVREMETPGLFNNGARNDYALGLGLGMSHGQRTVTHSGATAGYRAFLGRAPDLGAAVALLCNNGDIRSDQLGSALLELAMGQTPTPAPEHPPELGAAAETGQRAELTGTWRNERTEQPVSVLAFADGITLNTWTGYRARSDSEFVTADASRSIRLLPALKGMPRQFRLGTAQGDTVRYTAVEPWAPTAGYLGRYAGRYRSDEVNAEWVFAVKGDTLFHLSRDGTPDPLQPRYRDAFTSASGWLVLFRRNGRLVVGLDLGSTRTRKVGFRRE